MSRSTVWIQTLALLTLLSAVPQASTALAQSYSNAYCRSESDAIDLEMGRLKRMRSDIEFRQSQLRSERLQLSTSSSYMSASSFNFAVDQYNSRLRMLQFDIDSYNSGLRRLNMRIDAYNISCGS